ncbi:MAG TPA: hypothetical protein VI874_05080 [Candidatus Norongarragalinales archaeon]|nr:hypothetical protein [Candidatus Norongarragalinales archaeon]
MEYITKKFPKDAEALLHEYQAVHILETGEKLTDANALKRALEDALEQKKGRKKEKTCLLSDLKGFIKDGPASNAAEDVDRIVYGV